LSCGELNALPSWMLISKTVRVFTKGPGSVGRPAVTMERRWEASTMECVRNSLIQEWNLLFLKHSRPIYHCLCSAAQSPICNQFLNEFLQAQNDIPGWPFGQNDSGSVKPQDSQVYLHTFHGIGFKREFRSVVFTNASLIWLPKASLSFPEESPFEFPIVLYHGTMGYKSEAPWHLVSWFSRSVVKASSILVSWL